MEEGLLCFNGINGATGDYLLPQMRPEQIGRIALGEKWDRGHLAELRERKRRQVEGEYAIKSGLDPDDLSQTGWGVIFPAAMDTADQAAIEEALGELLSLRQAMAGPLYRVFKGPDGYRPGESKDDFLARHGTGPGIVDPQSQNVPYYLLIVGDPQTIPYRFQYELAVAYLVGRVHFNSLDEYASYARSIVTAEKPGALSLPRRAVFVGVANPNDSATQLSAGELVRPLAEKLQAGQAGWQIEHYAADRAYKSNLLGLLGGEDTPALLFTASHGLGFPYGDPCQLPFQGALVCQDWPGPNDYRKEVPRDFYLGAEDIGSDASLLGLVSMHFACYGAGTPYWDDFSKQAFSTRSAIASHAFLAALPRRLLGHPRGGALAVVGHVERAWTYSFQWGQAGAQTTTFEDVLTRMMSGETVGHAMDGLHLRYAEISTLLSNEVEEAEFTEPDLYKLARLWTAHNDARSYALIGDPAVRLPVAVDGALSQARPAILAVDHREAKLQPIPVEEGHAPGEHRAGRDSPQVAAESGDEAFFVGEESIKNLRAGLAQSLQKLMMRLAGLVEDEGDLEVTTYVSGRLDQVAYDPATHRFTGEVVPRLVSHHSLKGDTQVCMPEQAGEVGQALQTIHARMVEQAQANRTAMLKAAAEMISTFLAKGGDV